MAVADASRSGDRLATLEQLRDRLADEVDACDSTRDLPALVLRLTDVMAQIDGLPKTQQVSKADEIAERRAARRKSGSARPARAKRPG